MLIIKITKLTLIGRAGGIVLRKFIQVYWRVSTMLPAWKREHSAKLKKLFLTEWP